MYPQHASWLWAGSSGQELRDAIVSTRRDPEPGTPIRLRCFRNRSGVLDIHCSTLCSNLSVIPDEVDRECVRAAVEFGRIESIGQRIQALFVDPLAGPNTNAGLPICR